MWVYIYTGRDGAVAMSSANGLVGTEFVSRRGKCIYEEEKQTKTNTNKQTTTVVPCGGLIADRHHVSWVLTPLGYERTYPSV